MSNKPCARCKKRPRASNSYCRVCDAERKAAERRQKPKTEDDGVMSLLKRLPGFIVEFNGIRMESGGEQGVLVELDEGQRKKLLGILQRKNHGNNRQSDFTR